MISRVDSWLLGQVFQRIVNLTGQCRLRLMEWCAVGFAVFCLAVLVCFSQAPAWARVLGSLCAVGLACLMYFAAREPSTRELLMGRGSGAIMRFTFCFGATIELLELVLGTPDARTLSSATGNLLGMGAYYFAICEDPPPPRRRDSLVPGAA